MKECQSVQTTLKVIGGKWKLIILWYLHSQTLRFSELVKQIPDITQKMLTQQLREMETDGLIVRKVYPVVPPKVEYSITDYGRSLEPILRSMNAWGEKHVVRAQAGGARGLAVSVQGT
jgi:DNA-binding HxlR family transcriptional regulator